MSVTQNAPAGFEVPLHRALVEPILMVGLPRSVALLLWVSVAALAFGLRQLWVLPIGAAVHAVFAALTRADPHFFDIFVRAVRLQRRLVP